MISKFFELLFLFLVGSLIGYVLELIYRNLIDKEYINLVFKRTLCSNLWFWFNFIELIFLSTF